MGTTSDALASLGPIFRWSQAQEAGLSDPLLHRLLASNTLDRLSHGLYARTDELSDLGDLDLLHIASASSHATICLTSALARHDLTDEIPARIDIAIPRGETQPRLDTPTRWHRFAPDTFDIGRETLALAGGLEIGLYDPKRSIIDAYRMRHAIGPELGRGALKRWLNRRGSQPGSLIGMARDFPMAASQLRQDLEVLL